MDHLFPGQDQSSPRRTGVPGGGRLSQPKCNLSCRSRLTEPASPSRSQNKFWSSSSRSTLISTHSQQLLVLRLRSPHSFSRVDVYSSLNLKNFLCLFKHKEKNIFNFFSKNCIEDCVIFRMTQVLRFSVQNRWIN